MSSSSIMQSTPIIIANWTLEELNWPVNLITGMMTSCSALCVPAFMEAPAPLLAKQWKKMFDIGVVAAPILSATSAAIFGLMAYKGAFPHKSFLDVPCRIVLPMLDRVH